MRRSLFFLLPTVLLLAIVLLLPHHARRSAATMAQEITLMKKLRGTDLCLTTEARYTRHPALADRHAPFQDHPLALEHFPSGALLVPASGRGTP